MGEKVARRKPDTASGVLVAGSVALGAALVLASHFLGGRDPNWAPSTLANLGASVLLFAPVYWATLVLDTRIRRVGERTNVLVQEVSEKLSDVEADHTRQIEALAQAVAERRGKAAADGSRLTRALRQEPSRDAFADLHERAMEEQWLRASPDARVRVGATDVFVTVPASYRYSNPVFRVATMDGRQLASVPWGTGIGTMEFMAKLSDAVEAHVPGVLFDVQEFVEGYARLVECAASHRNLHGLVCVFEPQWGLSRAGLVPLDRPTEVLATTSLHDQSQREKALGVAWVDQQSLREAFRAIDSGMHA